MTVAARAGAGGVIFRIGSHKGAGFETVTDQIAEAITRVLEATPPEATLVLENSAGQGSTVSAKFAEQGR
ncbi:MAG: hypothetical protein U0531_11660 [Dehalococcoidia bacterium]